jgi:hypothetical protein
LEALVLRLADESPAKITAVLIQCAYEWYKRIAAPLIPADFAVEVTKLHMHFRLLAGYLLDGGRVEEGLVAFDAGRGIEYAVAVDPTFFSRVIGQNPFSADGGAIDLGLLRQIQQGLSSSEVAVVLSVIPPRMIAFLISSDRVDCVTCGANSPPEELETLDAEVKMLPPRLAGGVGLRAIPASLLAFAQEVVTAIGTRSVTRFIPYDSLHLVPWRALLHHCGLPWTRLPFSTRFSFLHRQGQPSGPVVGERTVVALGHGTAGNVDLQEEARAFASAFGDRGRTVLNCTAADVRRALGSRAVVLLSCHGTAVDQPGGPRLFLELSDGQAAADEIFPSSVSSPLVIMSACESGFYYTAWGGYPMGAAPMLIRRGASCVIGARFPVSAAFAAAFFPNLGRLLADGMPGEVAFVRALEEVQEEGADLWKDVACLELLKAT